MTQAKTRLTALADWIKASSQSYKTPLGGNTEVGPYAVLVPLKLDQAPAPTFDPEALPLWIPEAQAVANLPTIQTGAPASQDHMTQRLLHLIWMFQEKRFEGAVIGLIDPAESLQAVLNREAPDLDLTLWPVIFIPLWGLATAHRPFATRQLPFIP